uniref:Uncharacterized protein n=1 Tax=Timspurckia oligopyrenoides TaxID=708627 RepID=A0A7S0ZHX3_9RHOD|mmetsp:Transcript_5988/g.10642  ORF Transcript_5988/g.10642 Transcript_5988/m.10642 type:complete len:263 (+) Transcript_5988:3-791(+)
MNLPHNCISLEQIQNLLCVSTDAQCVHGFLGKLHRATNILTLSWNGLSSSPSTLYTKRFLLLTCGNAASAHDFDDHRVPARISSANTIRFSISRAVNAAAHHLSLRCSLHNQNACIAAFFSAFSKSNAQGILNRRNPFSQNRFKSWMKLEWTTNRIFDDDASVEAKAWQEIYVMISGRMRLSIRNPFCCARVAAKFVTFIPYFCRTSEVDDTVSMRERSNLRRFTFNSLRVSIVRILATLRFVPLPAHANFKNSSDNESIDR